MKRLLPLSLLLLAVPCHAATTTLGVSFASTSMTCSATNVTGSFTPAAGDVLVGIVHYSGHAVMTDSVLFTSDGIGFNLVGRALNNTSAAETLIFVAGAPARAVSQTATAGCTGTAPTGGTITIVRVSGMTRFGLNAVLQSAKSENQGSGGTPAITFGASVQTGNPTIVAVGNSTNPATMTPPTSWSETPCADTGYATPTTGLECATRDSGFTGTTVTWGGTSASAFGAFGIELDTSACSTNTCLLSANVATGSGAASTIASNATNSTAFAAKLIVAGISWSCSTCTPTVSSVTDTAGNTYTQLSGLSLPIIQSTNGTDMWYAVNPTTNAANVITANFNNANATFREIDVVYVSGTDTSTPYETGGTNSTAGATSLTTGSFSPAAANNYNFLVYHTGDSPFKTCNANYRQVLSLQTASVIACDRVDAPTGAQTGQGLVSASNNATIVLGSFKKASGGGGATAPPTQMMQGVGD